MLQYRFVLGFILAACLLTLMGRVGWDGCTVLPQSCPAVEVLKDRRLCLPADAIDPAPRPGDRVVFVDTTDPVLVTDEIIGERSLMFPTPDGKRYCTNIALHFNARAETCNYRVIVMPSEKRRSSGKVHEGVDPS